MFILAADKSCRISSSISTSSTACSPQVPNICSTVSKGYSSDNLLLATYFDIGIIRTLFSPSWLTDGYLWCLEYLHKRIMNISNEILSANHISSHYLKSFSISKLNNLSDSQITNNIIEKQYRMTRTTINSIKKQSPCQNFEYFFRQKRERK
jgi:hypothetical protein